MWIELVQISHREENLEPAVSLQVESVENGVLSKHFSTAWVSRDV